MPDDATPPDAARLREAMVDRQIIRRGVADPRILNAMRKVPREAFVAQGYEAFAFDDSPLPLEENQSISQPYIVAAMAEAAELKPTDKVLEIGTGSGYAAAVFAELAAEVWSIERRAALARGAGIRLDALGYGSINVRTGDGTKGWPEAAPFDAIIVAACSPGVPSALKQQLAIGGRLILPVGAGRLQTLRKLVRTSETTFSESELGRVQFVPLISG